MIIGGLKEKLIAAARGGINTVIIPHENLKDLEEVPENVLQSLEITAVKSIDEVLEIALAERITPEKEWARFSGFYSLPEKASEEKNKGKTH